MAGPWEGQGMSNSSTIKIALKIDDQGGVRVLQNVGKESSSTGQKGKKAFNDMDRSAKSFNDSAKMSMNTMLKMGAGIAGVLGLAKAWGMLKDSAKEYVELASVQEAAENKLEAVLKATGNAAGYNLAQLKAMASGLQDVTTMGDETTLAGMAILATFKEIKGEAFEGATKAAMDMSKVMDQDLKSSMVQIGKALNDPIQGLSALSRVGVSFTDDQKKMIKTLQESGDMMGAQKVILAELKSEFGGAAEAASKTFAGGLTQAQNALGDTKEEMGFVITKNQFFIELTHMATAEFKRWGEETQKNSGYLMDLAKDGVMTVVSSLKAGIETLRFFHNGWSGIKLVGQLAVQGLAFSLDALYPIIRSLLAPLDALYQGMVKLGVMDVNPFDAIGNGLATFKDSSAQVTKDVLADINKTNEKYDTISNTLQGYIDKIKVIPVAVAETTESEKKAHGLRMGQIDEQLKAVTELSEKELKALQETNQKKYAMDIALANQVQEDTWLIREKGLKKAIELHEDTQIKITQMEYDEAKKRNEKIEKAYEDSLKEQTRAHEQFVENVQDETADKFYDLFSSPRTFWKNALDEMTDYFYRVLAQWAAKAIAEPIIVPFIQQIGGGITSALGFGGSGAAGTGFGFSNILSAGQSLWGAYSGTTSSMAYNLLSQVPGLGFGGAISTGALAAGGELGWGASTMAALGSGTGAGGLAATLASFAPAVGILAMAAPFLMDMFKDDPDPRVGLFAGQHNRASTPTSDNYFYHTNFQDTDNRAGIGAALIDYFDPRFKMLDQITNRSINDIMIENGDWGQSAWVDPTSYEGNNQGLLNDIENRVWQSLADNLVADLVGSENQALFDLSFFDEIKAEGESAFDTFTRFGTVVNNTTDFLGQFTRQTQELGETGKSAFENLATISGIMTVIDSGMLKITNSTAVTTLDATITQWELLMETLEKSHATTEAWTAAEKAKNTVIGAQLTGLTADALTSIIVGGGDISGTLKTNVTNGLSAKFAETLMADIFTAMNEEAGKILASDGMDAAAKYIVDFDLTPALAQIAAFGEKINDAFGLKSSEPVTDPITETITENIIDMDKASQNLQTALEAEISLKEQEYRILKDNLNQARENYLAALDAEISKQEDARDAAERASDTYRDLAESLKSSRTDLLISSGILDPAQASSLAKGEYEKALQGAWNKDEKSLAALPDLAKAYLETSQKTLNKSEYEKLFGDIYRQLGTAEKIARVEAQNQVGIADLAKDQLRILEDQKSELNGVASTLLSIDQAADEYHTASLNLEQSGLANQISIYQDQLTELQNINTNIMSLTQAQLEYRKTEVQQQGGSGGYTFNEDIYYQNKLTWLNSNLDSPEIQAASQKYGNTGAWDLASLKAAHAAEGLTAQQDFNLYGTDRGISPYANQKAGYADGGIASGPKSGYWELLHGTEAVIPLGKGSLPIIFQGGLSMEPLVAEFRLLREVMEKRETSDDKRHFEITRELKTLKNSVLVLEKKAS